MNWKEILNDLTSQSPLQILDYVESILKKFAVTSRSPLGNLYGEMAGRSDHTVMLDAHLDEIGMIVVGIDPKGFLLVDGYGGVDLRTLSGSEVIVWGKKPLFGVFSIMPPHLKNKNQKSLTAITDFSIDVGLSKEQAEELVQPGDRVSFQSGFAVLSNHCFLAKGLDNRAGVAILLRVCELLNKERSNLPVRVIVQFSQMEEAGTGFVGGVTGANAWQPQEAIVVDAGFAAYPGSSYPTPGRLGGGPMIGVSPLLDRSISLALQNIAEDNQLGYTLDVYGGRSGTNADRMVCAGTGIPTGLVSYPLQNMHMPTEMVCQNDLEAVAQLLYAYLMKGGNCNE